MTTPPKLSTEIIREVGEALFGAVWQSEMAKRLGVPRQSVAYYLKSGGVSGAQAAAIIGLVSRAVIRDETDQAEAERAMRSRRETLLNLMARLESL